MTAEDKKTCISPVCDLPVSANGTCAAHRARQDRGDACMQDPIHVTPFVKDPLMARVMENVDIIGECWIWRTATKQRPKIYYGNKPVQVTRAIQAEKSHLTDDQVVYQECRDVRCVNPAHSVVVSQSRLNLMQSAPRRNTSGYKGVRWHRANNLWVAQINYRGKTYYCGSFADIADAVNAVRDKREELIGVRAVPGDLDYEEQRQA